MAKFLVTKGISHYLEELVKTAKERLVFISPYIKVDKKLKELIEEQNRLKLDIRIVYGKSELQNDEVAWLKSMRSVRLSFCQDLHAKCYLNENAAIITSMNLYEFSEINNNEMGIYVLKSDDPTLYEDIYTEAKRLVRIGVEMEHSGNGKSAGAVKENPPTTVTQANHGFCIRCRTEIHLDMDKPYCGKCFSVWARFGNPHYDENHCHACGSKAKTSLAKPLCYSCYTFDALPF